MSFLFREQFFASDWTATEVWNLFRPHLFIAGGVLTILAFPLNILSPHCRLFVGWWGGKSQTEKANPHWSFEPSMKSPSFCFEFSPKRVKYGPRSALVTSRSEERPPCAPGKKSRIKRRRYLLPVLLQLIRDAIRRVVNNVQLRQMRPKLFEILQEKWSRTILAVALINAWNTASSVINAFMESLIVVT